MAHPFDDPDGCDGVDAVAAVSHLRRTEIQPRRATKICTPFMANR
ncbi:hypothetical protein M2352_002444 [Azospirillum fermentarium]|nr:hypothetical protein [Azospirillum fermentarium]MCW2246853.1 hypothetical protein [Azospirillum fermentarium]